MSTHNMYFILYTIYYHALRKPLSVNTSYHYILSCFKAYNIKHEKEETVFLNFALTINQI